MTTTPELWVHTITLNEENDFGRAEVYLEFAFQTPSGETHTKTSPIHKMAEGETLTLDWSCAPSTEYPWVSWWLRVMEHDPDISGSRLADILKKKLRPLILARVAQGLTPVLSLGSELLRAALGHFSKDDFLGAAGGFLYADQGEGVFNMPGGQRVSINFHLKKKSAD